LQKDDNEASKQISSQNSGRKRSDVNIRSVYAGQQIARSGLTKLCTMMNLPPPVNKSAYNSIQILVCDKAKTIAETVVKEAANRLIDKTLEEEPDNIETNENREMIASVAVSVDGTWQKRGHTSKIGCVFVISVKSGEVLDYVVKSLVCQTCVTSKKKLSANEFSTWYDTHKDECMINHEGSSDKMESDGAKEIFTRSIKTRRLKYVTFVGDGDSSSYGIVAKGCEEMYGDGYKVTKEECVGHVQKRMGSRLRSYKHRQRGNKLPDGKGVGRGSNRLTDGVINKIQNFYGQSIRNNINDLEGMTQSIWAIYKHMIVDSGKSLEEQHSLCPKSEDTWCKF